MNRSPLVARIFAGTEKRRGVKQASFVVTANSHGRIVLLQLSADRLAESFRFRRIWISAEKSAANAQIKNKARGRAQIRVKNRSRVIRVGWQPPTYFFALGSSGQTARIAKRIVREPWMNRAEFFERFPCRAFANGHVRVVWKRAICDARNL